jgi:hypothetical protein
MIKLTNILNESVNEAKAIGKKIFSDAKGKLFFGYQNDDDTIQLVDYKTWKKLPMKDLSNEFLSNRVINSIVGNQKQFNKKVEYNMWSKKTNPSFEDRMDWFIKNNWISNITKTGIKESVEPVNEAVPTQTKWAVAIASLTATRPDAVQKFIDDNNLNSEKLYQFLKKSNASSRFGGFAIDFVTAISGKPGNPIQKKMIKMFGESVNEENEPTNPELWDKAIAAAKAKYDVYPSAYANAFASKWYKEKGGDWKTKKESINESSDINSLKKIHDVIFKFLKTKKGVGEVKEFSEFPNRYGDNVSTFSVKYNIEDKYNYDLQEIKIEYSTSRVFMPNKGYFPFRTFNDIKNIINTKSSLKESVNEVQVADFEIGDFIHFKRLNKTGMVTKISGNKVTIRTPQRLITGDIKDIEVLYQDGVIPSVSEGVSRDAAYIHGILKSGQDATQNFIDDNGLDGEKLSDYVKANRNNIDGYNVKHYISGEKGTVGSVPKLRQAFIKKFKKGKSVNESAKSDKLAILITKVIDKVDSSLSYKDFAMAVGKILKDDYGSHLYSSFVQELNKELKKENESIKLTSIMTSESKDSIREALTISIRNLIDDLVPRDIQNATTPQQMERRISFIRDLVKTLNYFYKQNRIDWRFADSNIKFKMYSKD